MVTRRPHRTLETIRPFQTMVTTFSTHFQRADAINKRNCNTLSVFILMHLHSSILFSRIDNAEPVVKAKKVKKKVASTVLSFGDDEQVRQTTKTSRKLFFCFFTAPLTHY